MTPTEQIQSEKEILATEITQSVLRFERRTGISVNELTAKGTHTWSENGKIVSNHRGIALSISGGAYGFKKIKYFIIELEEKECRTVSPNLDALQTLPDSL